MKRKTAFIIMLCLYLVTGAAACAILFNPDLRSAIPAVSSGSEEAGLAAPAVNTQESAALSVPTPSGASDSSDPSESSDTAVQPAGQELSKTTDSSAQTDSSDADDLFTQTESSDTVDPPAQPEQEQVSAPSDSSETSSAQKAEVKYRGIADQDKGKRLFIRKSPSTDGEVLGVLWTGQSGEIIDIGDEWVLLKYGDIEGYVFKQFLIIEELPQSEDPQGL